MAMMVYDNMIDKQLSEWLMMFEAENYVKHIKLNIRYKKPGARP